MAIATDANTPAQNEGPMTDNDIFEGVAELMGWQEPPEKAKPEPSPEVEPVVEQQAREPKEDEDEEQEERTPEEEEAEDSEEDWFPDSIEELAQAMGKDVDALSAIKVRTKVNGVESDVPLGEVIKNYQINKSLTERSEVMAQDRKTFENAVETFTKQRDESMEQWAAWNQILEQRLREQVGAVDWTQLREDDPAEYAARRQEFMERIGEIEHMKSQIASVAQQRQQEYVSQMQKLVEENVKKLPEVIPEYMDESTRKQEMQAIKKYLSDAYKFNDLEINSVYDARHVAIARKAMLYDQMKAAVAPKEKQLKEKPKFIKPSARPTAEMTAKKEVDKSYKKAVKSQKLEDWASVVEQRLNF